MKHQEVIDIILKTYDSIEFRETCDGFKWGDPQGECTGMVLSCALTIDVIRAAIRLGCNFIMVHEPSFYTHADDTDWLEGNTVFEMKKKLLDEHGIVVWRNHDHMHRAMHPDEIMQGVIKELGWTQYVTDGYDREYRKVSIPPMKLRELVVLLRERMHLRTGRVVGNMDKLVSNIVFCGHVFPSWDAKERIPTELLAQKDVDVLIPGELIDWTVTCYARDAEQLGMNKAIIQTGHFSWEEPGMKWMAERFKTLLPELSICFVPSGDPYQFI